MTPYQVYTEYLALKSHFTNKNYDYFKYNKKVRATITSFNRRKDRYFFERTSRKLSDKEIVDFLVSNFVAADTPGNLWIGEIINSGERTYADWMRRQQSLTYLFKEQSNELLNESNLEQVLDASRQHPVILKKFLSGKISIETFTIWDRIFLFGNKFDKQLLDPVWETVSLKIKKYNPFLNIDVFQFKRILREIIDE